MFNHKKVISFQEQVENALISRDLLWPCTMYRVDIQSSVNKDLNAFEILILRLAEQSYTEVDRIHNICCLDKDLIRFIQDRLTQLNLLDDKKNLSLTNEGRKQLNKLTKSQSNQENLTSIHSTVTGYIFVDKMTGKLLPIITQKQEFESLVDLDGKQNILRLGSAGSSQNIRTRTIRHPKDIHCTVPDELEVRQAMAEMKKQLKQKAFLGAERDPRIAVSLLGFEIDSTAEDVYLHTKLFLPQGAEDFIVTDGFGTGFSASFGRSMQEYEADWLLKLREGAIKTQAIDKNRDQSLFHVGIKKLYPNLGQVIEQAEAGYHAYHLNGCADLKELKTCVLKLYEVMEQALALVWKQTQVNDWQAYFHASNASELQELLIKLCQRSRFKLTKQEQSLFKFNVHQLRRAASGETMTLPALFALNLIVAQRQTEHPIHQLQYQCHDCLSQLFQLKQVRDQAAHGKDVEISFHELKELRNTIYRYLVYLLPTTADYLPQESLTDFILPHVDQSKLKATIVFEKMFDFYQRQKISIELKNQIIQTEQVCPEFEQEQTIDASRWVLEIATLFQQLFYQLTPPEKQTEPQELKNLARQKLTQAGFVLNQNQLPTTLEQVNRDRLNAAFHHIETTLGAQMLAFAIKTEPLKLHQLALQEPELVLFIDKILQLRGHGNKECQLNQQQVIDIKNKTYQCINLLLQA